jgi:Uma2 family endonuclease
MEVAELEVLPLVLRLHPAITLTEHQFFDFCQQNAELRIERTATGDLELLPLVGGTTSYRNAVITARLCHWESGDGTGISFDASCGFILPNGAMRSPDAAWVRRSRLQSLTAEEKQRFLPLCPDFVVEIRSPTDSLPVLHRKMEEYIANGAQLGWLLDPTGRRAYIYRPGLPIEQLDSPTEISADPELPGFVLDLQAIWTPGF